MGLDGVFLDQVYLFSQLFFQVGFQLHVAEEVELRVVDGEEEIDVAFFGGFLFGVGAEEGQGGDVELFL